MELEAMQQEKDYKPNMNIILRVGLTKVEQRVSHMRQKATNTRLRTFWKGNC